MQRRKQLSCVPASCDENCDSSSAASSSELLRQTPQTPRQGASSACRDVPMFTQQQIGLVCERMIREREGQLKDEYEQILSSKLAGWFGLSRSKFIILIIVYTRGAQPVGQIRPATCSVRPAEQFKVPLKTGPSSSILLWKLCLN